MSKIRKMSIQLTEPMKMDFDGEIGQIMIMVGKNGTGKTLVLKTIWALGIIGQSAIAADYDTDYGKVAAHAKYVLDRTYKDTKLSGNLKAYADNFNLDISIEEGEVVINELKVIDRKVRSVPIFMSKEMRTFDQITQYLYFKLLLGIKGGVTAENHSKYEKLMEVYRLYDVMYVEKMCHVFKVPLPLMTHIKKGLKNFELESLDIQKIGYAEKQMNFFFENSKNEKRMLTTLSAGEQSIINMTIASQL